ncbi:MAG TPA: lectin-like protein [Verrucomicrobiales bacterium]|nr:lectin-like protein [Verrucomicrobiales bacterium]
MNIEDPPHPSTAPDTATALDGMMAIYGKLTASLPPVVEEALPGAEIGNFRLIEKLAEGGMGVVWRAEQLTPVHREVALKILKLGMDTLEFVRRFHIELEALARLEHPNIARVYDAGITPRGRPFLVMELVRGGEPLTDFCRRSGADLRTRLALFATTCAAVQYAHQRGVIHRDLKPSNLLVSNEDGTPRLVVIDFGVAHAAGAAGESGNPTEPGRILGTPAYMSPEQADAGEAAADTRTDVYALGCVLYELITDQPPFDHDRIRTSSLVELARLLREEMPPRPSDRLRRAGEPSAAARVRGELDWVAMKALAKDPERRYRAAAALEDDVSRYLRGEAVMARPSSMAYRLRKLAARHKPATAAIIVATLALLIITGLSMWQAQREAQERQNAEAILRFFDHDLVSAARQTADAGGSSDPLDAAARRIDSEFGDRPVLAARLRTTLGRAYLTMGDPARAERILPAAFKILTDDLGPHHAEALRAAAGMAELSLARHNPNDSVKQWRSVLSSLEMNGSRDTPEHREASLGLAQSLAAAGEQSEAVKKFESLLQRSRAAPGVDTGFSGRVALAFAAALMNAGEAAPADSLIQEALKERETLLGPVHPETLAAVSALARVKEELGDAGAARDLLRRASDGLRNALGGAHPKTLAAQKRFAGSCERLGDEEMAMSVTISAAHALISCGRDREAIDEFLTASRLAQHFSVPEAADRFRATAWTISRRLGLPVDGKWLTRSRMVRFPQNGHLYQRFEIPMSWTDADAACRALGGHLATINSEAENQFVFAWMASDYVCWLGARRESDGTWRWVTGEPFDWTHWAGGEPSNMDNQENFLNFGNSRLTFLRKGDAWNDHRDGGDNSGWWLTYPVCEWEGPDVPPMPPSPAMQAASLPRTSVRFFQGTGHWYARINEPMSWTDAAEVCKALGGYLACPATAEENDFIYNQFASDRLCWLGGTDADHEGQWSWVSGEPFTFTKWAHTEPNNSDGEEHYLQTGSDARNRSRLFIREWNDMTVYGDWRARLVTYPVCEWNQLPRIQDQPPR